MVEIIKNLKELLKQVSDFVHQSTDTALAFKPNPYKWSKKEIMGHLIDSGINNLQRFTEIQFEAKPFAIRSYNQDELVQANNYQVAESNELLGLLIAINHRIIHIISTQTDESLAYQVMTPNNEKRDLKFLIEDYVAHFAHHSRQIIESYS